MFLRTYHHSRLNWLFLNAHDSTKLLFTPSCIVTISGLVPGKGQLSPSKFWAVGKSLKNFHPEMQILGRKIPHVVEFRGKIKIAST